MAGDLAWRAARLNWPLSLELPVVLVVEASRQAGSVAALVSGFRDHLASLHVAGVVLNGVSTERHQGPGSAKPWRPSPCRCWGCLPRHPSLNLPSRHLGLLPAHELEDVESSLEAWSDLAERHLDSRRLLPLLEAAAQPRPCGPQPGSDSLVPEAGQPAASAAGPVPGQRQGPAGAPGDRQRCRLSLPLPRSQ